jgi:PAS domain S-box-containing protein
MEKPLSTALRVLIVEDNPTDAELMVLRLEKEGFQLDWKRVQSEKEFLASLDSGWDLILADWSLPQFSGLRALELIHIHKKEIPFIIISGSIGEEAAIDAMHKGANDYLLKDRLERLGEAVHQALAQKRLREEKKRIDKTLLMQSAALNAAANAIVITDREGGIEWANQAFGILSGYNFEEFIGKNPRDLVRSGKHDQLFYKKMWDTILAGEVWSGELINKRKDGQLYSEEMTITPLKNISGKIDKFIAIKQDVSERKQAERIIAESESKFKWLYDYAPTAYHILTPDGIIMDVNRRWSQILGYPRDKVLGKEIFDFIVEEERKEAKASFLKKKAGKETFIEGSERNYLTKAGEVRAFRTHDFLVRDQQQKLTSVQTTLEDITERKQAEMALHESEKRYRSLFENSPIPLLEEDFSAVKQRLDALREQGFTDIRSYLESHPKEIVKFAKLVRVLDVNKSAVELYQAGSKEDWINNLVQVINVEHPGFFIDELVSIAEGRTYFTFEGEDQTLAGEHIVINLFSSAAPGYEEDLSKVLVSIVDITERKQAEKEMRRLITDLRNLGEAEKKSRLFAEALANNVISIKSSLNTDDILDSIITNIHNVLSSDAVNIMLIHEDKVRMVRSRGYKEGDLISWVKEKQHNLMELKTLKEVIRSKEYRITPNTEKSKDWVTFPETAWIKSNIIAPIMDEDTVIGFVNLDCATPDFYTEEHARQLTAFTDQVSTALTNARLYESTRQRLNRMQAMTQIDQAINSSLDLNVSLEIVLIQAKEQLHADAVDILLLDYASNSLVFSKAKGFKTDEIRKAKLTIGSGLPGKSVLERITVSIPDLRTAAESHFKNLLIEREGFVSYYCVPLITKGQLKGVLEVYFRQTFQADQEWKEFLETLAQQTAIAINNAELLTSLHVSNIELLNAYEATLKGWVDALDMRDHETEGHTLRVTDYSLNLARRMDIKGTELVSFQRGALLHDIGKVAVPDAILNKPGPLTDEEWVVMRRHPLHAHTLLSKSKYLLPALDIPYCHHEKWDGTGYPNGLKGEVIPLAARIFAIVDVWDALISDRPYRKAWSKSKALDYIKEQSGKHFDPEVVREFLGSDIIKKTS